MCMRLGIARQFISILLFSVAAFAQESLPKDIPVLVYHRFDPKISGPTTITTATFLSQIAYLSNHGFIIMPLEKVVDVVLDKMPSPPDPIVAITIDDGHRSVYSVLYPIIKERHIPVTLFIYPSAISKSPYALTWDQIREMQASGLVDIQSHTYWHPDFRKEKAHRSAQDYAAFTDSQLTLSRKKLDAELGIHVDLLAWPYGIVDNDLEITARRTGYRAAFGYDSKLAHLGDDPMEIHRIPISDSERGATFGALLIHHQSSEATQHADGK